MIKEKQVHILIGCADARDLNQIQLDAVGTTSAAFRKQGREVDMHVIRAAGSFVTPDVVMDIKRTFEQAQRNNNAYVPMSYCSHSDTRVGFGYLRVEVAR